MFVPVFDPLDIGWWADTRARPPSRTLVDPLDAFTASLPSKGLSAAADDAYAAAEKTKELVAKAGRGAYVNQEDLKKREVPDPGAWGVWRILDALRGYEVKKWEWISLLDECMISLLKINK